MEPAKLIHAASRSVASLAPSLLALGDCALDLATRRPKRSLS